MPKNKIEEMNLFLERLKLQYFASKQLHLKNFLKYKKITIPEEYGLEPDDLLHWNAEKRAFLARSIESIEGIKERHIQILLNQLDTVDAMQEKLNEALLVATDVKDLNTIMRTIETSYNMYSKIIEDLNIDAIIDNEYQENKEAIDNLLDSFATENKQVA